jgi:hypothetical protein
MVKIAVFFIRWESSLKLDGMFNDREFSLHPKILTLCLYDLHDTAVSIGFISAPVVAPAAVSQETLCSPILASQNTMTQALR